MRSTSIDDEEDLRSTKEWKDKAHQRGVAMVEVLEALEDEQPKKSLKYLILSKEAYLWTDEGKAKYTPQPRWLPGIVKPGKNVKPEQRFLLWKNGEFEAAFRTKLIVQPSAQEKQEIDLYACCRMTPLVQNKIADLQPRSAKLALPPHNRKGLALTAVDHGDPMLKGKVAVKFVDIPCYGPKLTGLIFELLNLDVVKKTASELRFMLPTRVINELVREKCVAKGTEFMRKVREEIGLDAASDERAVAKLDAFIDKVKQVDYCDFVNKRYEPHECGYEWVKDQLGDGWENNLEVHDFLLNFGFSKEFIKTKMGMKTQQFKDKKPEEQKVETAVKWMVKAADIFQFPGSMADVVNLIFSMLHKDLDPAKELDIDEVVETVRKFKNILEKGYWHRLKWVPNYMIQDSQMDDMVAWVLLRLVCTKKNQKLVCLVQLPDGEQKAASERVELMKMNLGPLKKRARDEGCDEQAVNDVDNEISPKDALINLMLAKHKDQLAHLQDQYKARSTLRSTVVPFQDPESKNMDEVLKSACLIPPRTIYIVSEYEMRAFTGKYTWNGEMFESGKKRMLLHPMSAHWCFSLDVDGMKDVDKYYQIKARKPLCMPHNTLGWDFLVQAENRHSQLLVCGEAKEGHSRTLHWDELLTEITIGKGNRIFGDVNLGVLRWSEPTKNRVLIAWQSDGASWWNEESKRWDNRERRELPKDKDEFESLWAANEAEVKKLRPVHDQPDIQKTLKIGGGACSERSEEANSDDADGAGGPVILSGWADSVEDDYNLTNLKEMKLKALKDLAKDRGCDSEEVADADGAEDPKAAVIKLIVAKANTNTKNVHDPSLLIKLRGMKLGELKREASDIGCDNKEIQDADDTDDPKKTVLDLILEKKTLKFQLGQHVVSLKSKSDCAPRALSMTDVGVVINRDFTKNAEIQVDFGDGLREWLRETDLAIAEHKARQPHKDSRAIWKSLNEAGDVILPDGSGTPTPPRNKPIFDVWIPAANIPDRLPPCRFWIVDEKNNNKRWRCGLDATCDSFTRCDEHARKQENNELKEEKYRCNFECPTYKTALAFLNELGVDIWIDHKWDRCYCSDCYGQDPKDDKIEKDASNNQFDYEQIAPRGWVGFGVVNSKVLRHEMKEHCGDWPIRFHGCKPDNLKDILRYGNLARPGDRLVTNVVMEASLRGKGAHKNDPVFYTSPTIAYSGLQAYARPKKIEALDGKVGQVVLQCNQDLATTTRGEKKTRVKETDGTETMGFHQVSFPPLGVCKHTPLYRPGDNAIETISKEPGGCVIRRVMIRTFDEKEPPTWNKVHEDFDRDDFIKNARLGQYPWLQEPVRTPETFRSPLDLPKGHKTKDGTLWL